MATAAARRQPVGRPPRRGAAQHVPARRDPQPHEAHLQPRRGEVPDDRHRRHHERADRHDHPIPPTDPYVVASSAGGHQRRPPGQDESGHRRHEPQQHGDPLDGEEPPQQQAADRQHRDPQRARAGLDALAGVEHRAVAGEEVVHHAEVDEGILVVPPVRPAADRDDQRRDVDRERAPCCPEASGRLGGGRRRRDGLGHVAGCPVICGRSQVASSVAAAGVRCRPSGRRLTPSTSAGHGGPPGHSRSATSTRVTTSA